MEQKLKRYEFDEGTGSYEEDQDGRFVKFSDIEPLIEAVRFYAKGRHWELLPMIGESIIDKGSTARQALKQVGIV